MSFSTLVFRHLYNPYPFSDLVLFSLFQALRQWGRDSPVSSCFIFMFALSQFSRPNYLGAWNRLGLIRQKSCHQLSDQSVNENMNSSNAFRIHALLYFVLIHLELKRYMYTPVVSSKTIPDSRPKWAKCFQAKKAQKSYP